MAKSITSFIFSFQNQLILILFFILSLIGILNHELWLDEAHHYTLARDSHNFSELLYNCRNEGHPLLWNVILFIITRFSDNVFYMQLAHILISCFTVMFICKSNLNLAEKIFIIFGYYFLFEYNIISRNYGLSAFFLFLFIYVYLKNKENTITLSIVIFLLANTHLFSLLLSFALVFSYTLTNKDSLVQQKKRSIFIAILILLFGWFISIYCIIPPNNYGTRFVNYDSSPYFSTERILKTLSVCLKGIFYIPDYTATENHYQNSLYYLSLNLKTWMIYFLSFAAISIPALILKNNRFAFTLYLSFIILFMPVYYFLPLVNGIRYFGFFYFVFIACFWIARPQVSKTGLKISAVIFFIQFINGIFMYTIDLRYTFSESKNISLYLNKTRTSNEPVFILNRMSRPAISAYSGEKYFGVENGQSLSFCLWPESLPDSILKLKLANALNRNSTSLIVSSERYNYLIDTLKLTRLKSFENGITRSENQTVYRYNR